MFTSMYFVAIVVTFFQCTSGQMFPSSRLPPMPLQPMRSSVSGLQRDSRQQSVVGQLCRINVPGCGLRSPNAVTLESTDNGMRYANSIDVPWQVAIRVHPAGVTKPWYCSGVIINESWILLPAYCLYHKRPGDLPTKVITISAGIINPFSNSTFFTKITSYSIHASYTGSQSRGFDIALIKSSIEFPLSTNGQINAICLPETEGDIEIGPVRCSGWPGLITNHLILTSGISDTIDRCVGVNTHDLPHELCSMSQSPPDCQLDYGSPCFRSSAASPMVPMAQSGPVVLIGLLSKKVTCRKPTVNSFSTARLTRVSFYHDWIAETIGACQGPRVTVTSRSPGAVTVTRSRDTSNNVHHESSITVDSSSDTTTTTNEQQSTSSGNTN